MLRTGILYKSLIFVLLFCFTGSLFAENLRVIEDLYSQGLYEDVSAKALDNIKYDPRDENSLELLKKSKDSQDSLKQAERLIEQGDYDKAIMILLKLRLLSPEAGYIADLTAKTKTKRKEKDVIEFLKVSNERIQRVFVEADKNNFEYAANLLRLLEAKIQTYQYRQAVEQKLRSKLNQAEKHFFAKKAEYVLAGLSYEVDNLISNKQFDQAGKILSNNRKEYGRFGEYKRIFNKFDNARKKHLAELDRKKKSKELEERRRAKLAAEAKKKAKQLKERELKTAAKKKQQAELAKKKELEKKEREREIALRTLRKKVQQRAIEVEKQKKQKAIEEKKAKALVEREKLKLEREKLALEREKLKKEQKQQRQKKQQEQQKQQKIEQAKKIEKKQRKKLTEKSESIKLIAEKVVETDRSVRLEKLKSKRCDALLHKLEILIEDKNIEEAKSVKERLSRLLQYSPELTKQTRKYKTLGGKLNSLINKRIREQEIKKEKERKDLEKRKKSLRDRKEAEEKLVRIAAEKEVARLKIEKDKKARVKRLSEAKAEEKTRQEKIRIAKQQAAEQKKITKEKEQAEKKRKQRLAQLKKKIGQKARIRKREQEKEAADNKRILKIKAKQDEQKRIKNQKEKQRQELQQQIKLEKLRKRAETKRKQARSNQALEQKTKQGLERKEKEREAITKKRMEAEAKQAQEREDKLLLKSHLRRIERLAGEDRYAEAKTIANSLSYKYPDDKRLIKISKGLDKQIKAMQNLCGERCPKLWKEAVEETVRKEAVVDRGQVLESIDSDPSGAKFTAYLENLEKKLQETVASDKNKIIEAEKESEKALNKILLKQQKKFDEKHNKLIKLIEEQSLKSAKTALRDVKKEFAEFKKYKKKIAYLENRLEKSEQAKEQAKKTEQKLRYKQEAQLLLDEGKYVEAIKKLEEANALDPKDRKIFNLLRKTKKSQEDYKSSLRKKLKERMRIKKLEQENKVREQKKINNEEKRQKKIATEKVEREKEIRLKELRRKKEREENKRIKAEKEEQKKIAAEEAKRKQEERRKQKEVQLEEAKKLKEEAKRKREEDKRKRVLRRKIEKARRIKKDKPSKEIKAQEETRSKQVDKISKNQAREYRQSIIIKPNNEAKQEADKKRAEELRLKKVEKAKKAARIRVEKLRAKKRRKERQLAKEAVAKKRKEDRLARIAAKEKKADQLRLKKEAEKRAIEAKRAEKEMEQLRLQEKKKAEKQAQEYRMRTRQRLELIKQKRREEAILEELTGQIHKLIKNKEFDKALILLDKERAGFTVADSLNKIEDLAGQIRQQYSKFRGNELDKKRSDFERRLKLVKGALSAQDAAGAQKMLSGMSTVYGENPDLYAEIIILQSELSKLKRELERSARETEFQNILSKIEALILNNQFNEAEEQAKLARKKYRKEKMFHDFMDRIKAKRRKLEDDKKNQAGSRFQELRKQVVYYVDDNKFLKARVTLENMKNSFADDKTRIIVISVLEKDLKKKVQVYEEKLRNQRFAALMEMLREKMVNRKYSEVLSGIEIVKTDFPDKNKDILKLIKETKDRRKRDEAEFMRKRDEFFKSLIEDARYFIRKEQFDNARTKLSILQKEFLTDSEYRRDVEKVDNDLVKAEANFLKRSRERRIAEAVDEVERLIKNGAFKDARERLLEKVSDYPEQEVFINLQAKVEEHLLGRKQKQKDDLKIRLEKIRQRKRFESKLVNQDEQRRSVSALNRAQSEIEGKLAFDDFVGAYSVIEELRPNLSLDFMTQIDELYKFIAKAEKEYIVSRQDERNKEFYQEYDRVGKLINDKSFFLAEKIIDDLEYLYASNEQYLAKIKALRSRYDNAHAVYDKVLQAKLFENDLAKVSGMIENGVLLAAEKLLDDLQMRYGKDKRINNLRSRLTDKIAVREMNN